MVCASCEDQYQPNGQRSFILPPDPVPVLNARPEMYVADDNPLSGLGAAPIPSLWPYGNQIGTLTNNAGVPAAFDGNTNKPLRQCAVQITIDSSYANYVGINWSGNTSITPSSLGYPTVTHSLTAFTLTAPNDATFGSSVYVVQGSSIGGAWANWTTLNSGTCALTNGESITAASTYGRYQYHRAAFLGVATQIALAQASFSVGEVQ